MRNILPSEQAPHVPRSMLELVTSAAKHPQHHAAAGAVPAGRRSDAKRSRDADDDDDDETGGDDDDGESTEFRQYYHVSPAQQAFNEEVAHGYTHNELLRSEITVYPDNLLASGCKQELVGLGPVHVCAPQLHMGLPLTPCPRHGWAAVDYLYDGAGSARARPRAALGAPLQPRADRLPVRHRGRTAGRGGGA